MRSKCQYWFRLTQGYIEKCLYPSSNATCKSLRIVYYENLMGNLQSELRRLLSYLPIQIDDERLKCAIADSEGRYHRPSREDAFDPFTKEQVHYVMDFVKQFYALIELEGLPPEPPVYNGYVEY